MVMLRELDLLLEQNWPIHGVDAAILLFLVEMSEKFIVIIRLHQCDGLLKLLQVLLKHEGVLKTTNKLRKIPDIHGYRGHLMWVDLLDIR